MKRKERIEKMERLRLCSEYTQWFRSQMITEGHPHECVFSVEFAGLVTFIGWYKVHMKYRESLTENKGAGM